MAKLGEVCKLNMGQSPDSSSYNDTGDGIPFFQGNADFGEVHPNIRVWCNAPTKIAHPGEILISVRAPIGAMNIADCECCIGRGLASISADEAVCTTKYLWYGISSKIEELNAKGTGSTFKAVNKKTLEETEIPIRDLMEQERIVAKLDSVTALITLRKRQVKKLDELVKARFVEMFGNPKDNKKEWNRVPLKKVAEVRGRVGWKGYKKEDLQESGPLVLGATHLTENGNIDLSSPVYLSRDKYEESPEIMLHRNDLVFTQRRNTIGKVGLVKEDIGEATINPCVLILRPTNIHPIYLDVYFIMDEVKKDMWRLNAGSAQPMITQKGISEYLLMLPPIELQNQFAAFVERVDQQKQTVQQSLEKLELMKKALMQEYFG